VSTESLTDSIPALLQHAYDLLKQKDIVQADELLEKALSVDFDHPEVVYALKCVNFWKERENRLAGIQTGFEKGEYLLSQWKAFQGFLNKLGSGYEQCRYAFRQYVFTSALDAYRSMLIDSPNQEDVELLLRIGKCDKGKGDYLEAIKHFESAAQLKRDDPEVLAELGDCYALVNEMKPAKAFFREAFFLNPQKIDLEVLESEMMRRLAAKLKGMGLASPELEEWIPVYGVLFGVFTIKRELRPIEIGKLKQSIYQLEKELKESGANARCLTPRLVNRYFWLIDHYIITKEDKSRIDEVLLKIKLLDASVYKQYIS
jgi:tetratricopeptide (TPR) repeat protein